MDRWNIVPSSEWSYKAWAGIIAERFHNQSLSVETSLNFQIYWQCEHEAVQRWLEMNVRCFALELWLCIHLAARCGTHISGLMPLWTHTYITWLPLPEQPALSHNKGTVAGYRPVPNTASHTCSDHLSWSTWIHNCFTAGWHLFLATMHPLQLHGHWQAANTDELNRV